MTALRERWLAVIAAGVLAASVLGTGSALAGGGGPCEYASNPATSQARGQQVTVTGTFGAQHQNGVIQVLLRSGGTDYPLAPPNGMTDGSGAFNHIATIPVSTPLGDYALITTGPGPPDNPVFCSKPFTVTQGGGGFTTATTTTLGEAAPTTTTTAAPVATTTTVAPTTTTTTTEAVTTTTTLPPETTTTVDDLLASDDVTSSGIPLWLLIAFLLALLVGVFGYIRGRQPRTPDAP